MGEILTVCYILPSSIHISNQQGWLIRVCAHETGDTDCGFFSHLFVHINISFFWIRNEGTLLADCGFRPSFEWMQLLQICGCWHNRCFYQTTPSGKSAMENEKKANSYQKRKKLKDLSLMSNTSQWTLANERRHSSRTLCLVF